MKNDNEILLTSENVKIGLFVENIQNPQWDRWRILSRHKFIDNAWNIGGENGRGNKLVMVGEHKSNWKIVSEYR